MSDKPLTIVVGTNSLTNSQYPAYTNHCQFWFRLGRSFPHTFVFMNPSRMPIDRMRNATIKVALECNADYVLFMDDDVLVDSHLALGQLLQCESDIAAGKVVIRGYPFDYMVFQENEEKTGLHAEKQLPKSGIIDCYAVGFSFALIKTELFRKMSEPWCVTGPTNTEDIYFCIKAHKLFPELTVKINCACDCGHILWPEIMNSENREAYADYYVKLNPELKPLNEDPAAINPADWRGDDYLKRVKSLIESEPEVVNHET
jgi:hypothetical protein